MLGRQALRVGEGPTQGADMQTLIHIIRALLKGLSRAIVATFFAIQFFATLTGPDNAREACYFVLAGIDQTHLCSMFDLRSMRGGHRAPGSEGR